MAPCLDSQPSTSSTLYINMVYFSYITGMFYVYGVVLPLLLLCTGVVILLLLLELPLLVMACRMTRFVAGSLNLVPVFFFSSFKHDLFRMYYVYPLTVLSHLRPRFVYWNTRSQGGHQAPLYIYLYRQKYGGRKTGKITVSQKEKRLRTLTDRSRGNHRTRVHHISLKNGVDFRCLINVLNSA